MAISQKHSRNACNMFLKAAANGAVQMKAADSYQTGEEAMGAAKSKICGGNKGRE